VSSGPVVSDDPGRAHPLRLEPGHASSWLPTFEASALRLHRRATDSRSDTHLARLIERGPSGLGIVIGRLTVDERDGYTYPLLPLLSSLNERWLRPVPLPGVMSSLLSIGFAVFAFVVYLSRAGGAKREPDSVRAVRVLRGGFVVVSDVAQVEVVTGSLQWVEGSVEGKRCQTVV
jgi:hypothetical protein